MIFMLHAMAFFFLPNDSVLDFYPKFGFQKAKEYRFCADISHSTKSCAEPISMETKQDWLNFMKEKNQRFSNGILQLNTDDLIMFYLTQFMQNNVYFVKELDAYVIAEKDKTTILFFMMYFQKSRSL